MRSATPVLLLYDGDCRVCRAFARAAARLAPAAAIQARPIQAARELLAGMSEAEALASAHVVTPGGTIRHGSAILPALAGAFLARPSLEDRVNRSPRARAATERAYEVLVALRGNLNCVTGASASEARSPR